MTVLDGAYTHHELRLIYAAKGDVLMRMADLAAPTCLTDRIPHWLRANAAEFYALAVQEGEKEKTA